MKVFCVLLLLNLFITGFNSKRHRPPRDQYYVRIVGGKNTTIEKWPFMATLVLARVPPLPDTLICTAVIVHPYWVLLAGSCIVRNQNFNNHRIRSNCTNYDRSDPYTEDRRIVDWKIKMLNEDLFSFAADLGLVKVDRRYGSPREHIISLVPEDYKYVTNSKATQIGWGATELTTIIPSITLRTADTRLANQKQCAKFYKVISNGTIKVTDDMVCAFAHRKGACYGDSGGPLVQGRHLIGILSEKRECAADHLPNVYTRVAHFIDWINSTIADDKEKERPKKKPHWNSHYGNY